MQEMGKLSKEKICPSIEYDGELSISEGTSRTTKIWKNKTIKWSDLLVMLSKPVETFETADEYQKFPKSKKDDIKDVGGIVGGWLKQGKRKRGYVQQRSMVILDADSTTNDLWDDVKLLFDHAAAICTTHSHSAKNPRYRSFIPLSRPVTAEEYEPIARKIAATFGMDNFDDTTYQAERLMHKPSHSKEAEYIFKYQDLAWANPDELLNSYEDWQDVSFWPESSRVSNIRERQAKKAGDPLTKKGIVGAFCRTYDIVSAIETFLPDVYGPTGHDDRWTYLGGSTAGGLVIYDDKFAYSHHGTDPVGDQLSNAFDLVRIHKFGDLDDEVNAATPINRYPSYKAMRDFAMDDDEAKKEMVKDQMASAREDFEDVELSDDEWLKKLRFNNMGKLENSIYNGYLFLENYPTLEKSLKYNLFTHQIEKAKGLPWMSTNISTEWAETDATLLRAYFDENSMLRIDKGSLQASVLQSATQRSFHPVKDYIERETWDGVERVSSVFIDYLGVEDSVYTREVTKKWFTGAVARIYRPGVKFEMVPILSGEQGLGKSTLIQKLAPSFFSDSLRGLGESKDDLQFLIGSWLLEISELSAMKRTEVEKTKQFISTTSDRFRVAYAEGPQTYQRTCVFIGTSNDDQFLKDKTGNRRFYPLSCDKTRRTRTVFDGSLEKIVGQLWAEAKSYFDRGEKLHLDEEIEKMALDRQKEAMIEDLTEKIIYEYLEIELPEDWYSRPDSERSEFIQSMLKGEKVIFESENIKYKPRLIVTSKEIYTEAFNKNINFSLDARSNSEIRKIGLVMNNHPGWKKQTIRLPDRKGIADKGFKRL